MKKKRLLAITLVITLFASIFALAGCGKQKEASNNDEYNGKLVFDHSMDLKYAELFSVDYYKGGYKMITITNRDEDTAITDKQSKILVVPDGMKTPEDVSKDTIVLNGPVKNMLVASTPVTSLMNLSLIHI